MKGRKVVIENVGADVDAVRSLGNRRLKAFEERFAIDQIVDRGEERFAIDQIVDRAGL